LEQHIWQTQSHDDVLVIGLNPGGLTGQDQKYMADYANNLGLTFPIARDLNGTYGMYVGTDKIAPFPLDVVVGRDGRVRTVSRDFDVDALRAEVLAALSE